jgi:hypothetical protein
VRSIFIDTPEPKGTSRHHSPCMRRRACSFINHGIRANATASLAYTFQRLFRLLETSLSLSLRAAPYSLSVSGCELVVNAVMFSDFEPRYGEEFSFLHLVKISSWIPIQYIPGSLSPGVKRQGPEAHHSQLVPRSRKRGSIHQSSITSSCRSA